MPRKPRFFLPGVPAQVVQRGNNRQPIFFADADYQAYLGWLAEAAGRYGCAVHAYVLITCICWRRPATGSRSAG